MATVVQPRECAWREELSRRKLWEKIARYMFSPILNVEKCQIYVLEATKLFQPKNDDMFSFAGSLAILTLPLWKIGS